MQNYTWLLFVIPVAGMCEMYFPGLLGRHGGGTVGGGGGQKHLGGRNHVGKKIFLLETEGGGSTFLVVVRHYGFCRCDSMSDRRLVKKVSLIQWFCRFIARVVRGCRKVRKLVLVGNLA